MAHPGGAGRRVIRRGGKPVKLGDVLGGVLEEHGLREQVRRMGVLELWPEIVGEHIASVTRAKVVSEAALIVEVRTSAWLMELDMMKGELLGRVNERLPETPLERIVFVLAETA
jgi:predicted nucleic acid-binding Zn ribbon protein